MKAHPLDRGKFRERLNHNISKRKTGRRKSKPLPKTIIAIKKDIQRLKENDPHGQLHSKENALVLAEEISELHHIPTAVDVTEALIQAQGLNHENLYPWISALDSLT